MTERPNPQPDGPKTFPDGEMALNFELSHEGNVKNTIEREFNDRCSIFRAEVTQYLLGLGMDPGRGVWMIFNDEVYADGAVKMMESKTKYFFTYMPQPNLGAGMGIGGDTAYGATIRILSNEETDETPYSWIVRNAVLDNENDPVVGIGLTTQEQAQAQENQLPLFGIRDEESPYLIGNGVFGVSPAIAGFDRSGKEVSVYPFGDARNLFDKTDALIELQDLFRKLDTFELVYMGHIKPDDASSN